VPITDVNVTINGQTADYNTTYGNYYLPSITGNFGEGSVFTVTISHPRVVLTRTLTVPTSTVPSTFTFDPLTGIIQLAIDRFIHTHEPATPSVSFMPIPACKEP
jgi:hypothetical protein